MWFQGSQARCAREREMGPSIHASIVALATLAHASRLAIPHTVECIHAMVTERARQFYTDGRTPAMVQIGAHLAWQNPNDPFGNLARTARLRTVLVEPQPHIASRLDASVRASAGGADGGAVSVRNCAVCAGNDGNVTFYAITPRVDPMTGQLSGSSPDAPQPKRVAHFTSQLASMSREHILKHSKMLGPNAEELIVELQVPCLQVASLLRAEAVAPDDVLVLSVDAEGFDAEIVMSVDFNSTRPFLLVWEFQHVVEGLTTSHLCENCPDGNTKEGKKARWAIVHNVERHLASFGYFCWRVPPENMYCTSPSFGVAYTQEQMDKCGSNVSSATARAVQHSRAVAKKMAHLEAASS